MNHRERVQLAINHFPVDRLPCAELLIGDDVVEQMYGEVTVDFEHRLEFLKAMGLDAFCLHPDYGDIAVGMLSKAASWTFDDLNKWTATDYYTFAVLDGPVGWGARLFGYARMLGKLTRLSADIADLTTLVAAQNILAMKRLADNGIDGIIIADDIAFNGDVIVRPNILRQILFPSLAFQVEQAKKLNLTVFFHSDGNLSTVLDDIVELGVDGLQCIEAQAGMDIGQVRRQYGQKLCLWGNLDPQELFEPFSRTELERKVRQIATSATHNGSDLIFGTSSGLFGGMRLKNIKCAYGIAQGVI